MTDVWLRQLGITPSDPSAPEAIWQDRVSYQIEHVISENYAALLKTHQALSSDPETTPDMLQAWAVNLVVGAALAQQRQHAPGSHKGMMAQLLGKDPLHEELRKGLYDATVDAARIARSQGFFRGVLVGAAVAALAAFFV